MIFEVKIKHLFSSSMTDKELYRTLSISEFYLHTFEIACQSY